MITNSWVNTHSSADHWNNVISWSWSLISPGSCLRLGAETGHWSLESHNPAERIELEAVRVKNKILMTAATQYTRMLMMSAQLLEGQMPSKYILSQCCCKESKLFLFCVVMWGEGNIQVTTGFPALICVRGNFGLIIFYALPSYSIRFLRINCLVLARI